MNRASLPPTPASMTLRFVSLKHQMCPFWMYRRSRLRLS